MVETLGDRRKWIAILLAFIFGALSFAYTYKIDKYKVWLIGIPAWLITISGKIFFLNLMFNYLFYIPQFVGGIYAIILQIKRPKTFFEYYNKLD